MTTHDWLIMTAVDRCLCPTCGAEPGVKCTSRTGGPAQTHTKRYRPLQAAFQRGFMVGRQSEAARRDRRKEAR